MKKNIVFMYIAVTLAVLVPVPGRFGYGILLVLGINFLMLVATATGKLLDFISLDAMRPLCILVMLVCATVFFKQLVILYSPLCALTLGFVLYLPMMAVLMLGNCFENETLSLCDTLKQNMKDSAFFSLYALFFFLVRDIAGYGTITFPAPSGLMKLILPQIMKLSPGSFWATIPGGIVLAGLLLAGISLVKKKCLIISRSNDLKEEASAG